MSAPSRRRVLAGAAGLAAAGLAAACSDVATPTPRDPTASSTAPSAGPPTTTPPPGPAYTGDPAGAALAAALANLAVDLYTRALSEVSQNRYGAVPGVVTSFLSGAGVGQSAAARAWNDVLTTAGRPAVTGTPVSVADARRAALDRATTPTDLLALAHDLETSVAATLVGQLRVLVGPTALSTGATLAPVAAMRAATAAFLLGRPPGTPPGPDAAALDRAALTV